MSFGKTKEKSRVNILRLGCVFGWLSLALVFRISVLAQAGAAAEPKMEARWYSIFLGQQKVGYIKEYGGSFEENGQKKIKTVSESRMVFNRLGKKIEMIIKSENVETESGWLEKVRTEEILSSSVILVEAEVENNLIRLKTTTGGQTHSRELKFSGELLGPVGIGNLTREKLNNPGERFEFQTLLAELGQVVRGERTLVAEEELNLGGKKIKARKLEEKFSGLPQTRNVWIDEEGNELRSEEPSPFGQMVVVLSDEKEAKSGLEEATPGQDQLSSSLIKANVRLPQARNLDRLVVRLKHKKPELGWPELQNDYQRIIKKDSDTVVLELRRAGFNFPSNFVLTAGDRESFLKSNAYLQPEEPEINRVAREVAGLELTELEKALKLRDWVARNMSFDLGFVFAPASEVIKNKKGTCAGYAALLASLLRAAGLPSRYVVGLAYVNGVWGGHAWVEAWIRDRWVPLDAALCSPGVADAARLAVAWSSLEEGLGELLLPVQKIIGYLEIEILEYEFAGKIFKVAENQPLYEIKGDFYYNYGLGLRLRAPAGFEFSALDRVWPDKTLLRLKNHQGQTIKLSQEGWFPAGDFNSYLVELLKKEIKDGILDYQKVWGRKIPRLVSSAKSAVALPVGVDVFVLVVEGQKSADLLREVLKNIHLDLPVKASSGV
ncbi:MAG: transglutaminase domain-containing protein [Candidatus Aminicenantes bacterium]|nr:transglutaminase domain-containing protein [Candidatus Aminicenantes bacterium]